MSDADNSNKPSDDYVLVLYFSRYGSTAAMAEHIASGVNNINGIRALVRTVAPISDNLNSNKDQGVLKTTAEPIPETGPLYCTHDELQHCKGLVLGSPTRFGNMAAALKYFIDSTSNIWMSGALINKPAAVFCSTSSMHGGNETTLLSMMLPLLHHGMIMAGLPYSLKALHQTQGGGTPYGVTHVSGVNNNRSISDDEIDLCKAQGERIARLAIKLTE